MPRLLMVSQPTTAGVGQCVIDWSVGLRASGWDVVVACPDEGDLAGWCEEAGIPRVHWESQRSPFAGVAQESAALRNIVGTQAPDVVMLHSSKAGLDGRLTLRGKVPTVFVPHAWSFDATTGKAAAAALTWERLAAWRWTDLVFCVSAAEYQRGVKSRVRATYQVTRNGVDLEALRRLTETAPDRTQLAASLGLSPATRLAVCLGRLTEQKGQDVLAAAWPMVPGGDARHLVVIGDGPLEDDLRTCTAGDATVTLAGALPRSDAMAWLAAADVVCVPSRWEGMALVPLEALAVGTPVVGSDVTGLREAVSSDVGELVAPDDPAALSAALSSWLSLDADDRHRARSAAMKRADTHFSLELTIRSIDYALRDVLRRRND